MFSFRRVSSKKLEKINDRERKKEELTEKDKYLKNHIRSSFLTRYRQCGVCKNGIRFQRVWIFTYDRERNDEKVCSLVCRRCAPTRKQLMFMSISFNKENIKIYNYSFNDTKINVNYQ